MKISAFFLAKANSDGIASMLPKMQNVSKIPRLWICMSLMRNTRQHYYSVLPQHSFSLISDIAIVKFFCPVQSSGINYLEHQGIIVVLSRTGLGKVVIGCIQRCKLMT